MTDFNAVKAKCKYCGQEFQTDVRHPHACCCGFLECRRAAARCHSKHHYQSLKALYGARAGRQDPYHSMLDRKRSERQRRLRSRTAAAPPSTPAPLPPRIRPVSTLLLFSVLEMVFGFISPAGDPDETRRSMLASLERAAQLHDSPACLSEMRNLIELFHARFPHICSSMHGAAPHVCSPSPP